MPAPKPWNPEPRFASNTPEALQDIPAYSPYGSAWILKKERTPLPRLPLREQAPEPEEEIAPASSAAVAATPTPPPPSLLAHIMERIRGFFGSLLGALYSPWRTPASPLLPAVSPPPSSPLAGPATHSSTLPPIPPCPSFLLVPAPPTPYMGSSADWPSTMATSAPIPIPIPPSLPRGSPWRTGDYDG